VHNRETGLVHPRERKGSDFQSMTRSVARPTKVPKADRDWHPIAKGLARSPALVMLTLDGERPTLPGRHLAPA
jgi:hypothetical protein